MDSGKEASRTIPSKGRSLARLFIGFVEAGVYELFHRIQSLEKKIADEKSEALENKQEIGMIYGETHNESPLAVIEIDWTESRNEERSSDMVRYAVIGLMFDTQERVSSGLRTINWAAKQTGRLAEGILLPVSQSRLFTPVRKYLDALVERGEEEVNRWVRIGRSEETHSRALAQMVQDDFINGVIEYLTGNEEIVGLVETQSASLATEVVEEVRERTVSADTFLEGVTRSVLRRPPRPALPEPPPEVRQRAAPLHPKINRSKKTGARPR